MYYDRQVYIDEDDQCYDCKHLEVCPLMECLNDELVSLECDLLVQNCGFYEKIERRLKLIE